MPREQGEQAVELAVDGADDVEWPVNRGATRAGDGTSARLSDIAVNDGPQHATSVRLALGRYVLGLAGACSQDRWRQPRPMRSARAQCAFATPAHQ